MRLGVLETVLCFVGADMSDTHVLHIGHLSLKPGDAEWLQITFSQSSVPAFVCPLADTLMNLANMIEKEI